DPRRDQRNRRPPSRSPDREERDQARRLEGAGEEHHRVEDSFAREGVRRLSPQELRQVEPRLLTTLEHAARAPFYRRSWGRRFRGITTLAQLSRLPLIDKSIASRHQRDLIVGQRPPQPGTFSSGTTRGEAYQDPLDVPHTQLE